MTFFEKNEKISKKFDKISQKFDEISKKSKNLRINSNSFFKIPIFKSRKATFFDNFAAFQNSAKTRKCFDSPSFLGLLSFRYSIEPRRLISRLCKPPIGPEFRLAFSGFHFEISFAFLPRGGGKKHFSKIRFLYFFAPFFYGVFCPYALPFYPFQIGYFSLGFSFRTPPFFRRIPGYYSRFFLSVFPVFIDD